MKTLTLSLKRKWFEMIRDGVKLEEYREISDYWKNRLYDYQMDGSNIITGEFKKYDKVVFTMGYPKADDTSRRLEFKNPKIKIGTGRPKWGAEQGKRYFVITWDKP